MSGGHFFPTEEDFLPKHSFCVRNFLCPKINLYAQGSKHRRTETERGTRMGRRANIRHEPMLLRLYSLTDCYLTEKTTV